MTTRSLLTILLFYGLCGAGSAFAQSIAQNQSLPLNEEEIQKAFLRAYYSGGSGFTSDLVFGQEYYAYHSRSNSKPILFDDDLYTSSIIFDGKYYDNIKLQYDAYTDEVVYIDLNLFLNFTSYQISLNKDKIEMFSLYRLGDTLNFYRIDEGGSNLEPRFYEVPYQGITRLAIKYYCTAHIEKTIEQFKIRKAFFLDTGDGFYRFRGKRQFIKLFGAGADEIRSIIDENDIRFSLKDPSSIVTILKKYDQLLLESNIAGG
ncbi:MAG: hypothetical protein ACOX5K_05920 [Bacteroidales bacterium]|jgi:hypothetical protein|nr:hypothetical protein [Bacteroidota bacterium]